MKMINQASWHKSKWLSRNFFVSQIKHDVARSSSRIRLSEGFSCGSDYSEAWAQRMNCGYK